VQFHFHVQVDDLDSITLAIYWRRLQFALKVETKRMNGKTYDL
jgi:hypothetical protein